MRKWNMWTTKEEEEAEDKKPTLPAAQLRYNPQVLQKSPKLAHSQISKNDKFCQELPHVAKLTKFDK